jgi:hypothetical protein
MALEYGMGVSDESGRWAMSDGVGDEVQCRRNMGRDGPLRW